MQNWKVVSLSCRQHFTADITEIHPPGLEVQVSIWIKEQPHLSSRQGESTSRDLSCISPQFFPQYFCNYEPVVRAFLCLQYAWGNAHSLFKNRHENLIYSVSSVIIHKMFNMLSPLSCHCFVSLMLSCSFSVIGLKVLTQASRQHFVMHKTFRIRILRR